MSPRTENKPDKRPRQPAPVVARRTSGPAPVNILTEENLLQAIRVLQEQDPVCTTHMLGIAGHPPLRARRANLSGLAWIVISQQVSTASARAIYARFEAKFSNLHHTQLLEASDLEFRACGLSAPKIRTLRAIATAIEGKSLDLAALAQLDSDTARAKMTAVKGIGPWTADIYLLFCLGHPDVWPAGDLALQEGVRLALKLRSRPDAKQLEKLSSRWQPYRAAAARLIWAYYGKMLERKRADATRS